MHYALVTTVPPTIEPVSLALAKTHLRIDHDEENDLIQAWIAAARRLTEEYTGRRWVTQTVRMTLTGFPSVIEFPVGPVASVTSVAYLDVDGEPQVVDAADYQTWLDHNPPILLPAPLSTGWPDTESERAGSVTVTFVAGAAVEDVPEMVKPAMLQIIGQYDEARGDQNWLTSKGIPPSAKALLNMLETGSYLSR